LRTANLEDKSVVIHSTMKKTLLEGAQVQFQIAKIVFSKRAFITGNVPGIDTTVRNTTV
jgi:hypothetical protein